MTKAQENMKRRLESEDRGTKVYTQAEFDRLYGGGKTRTGRTSTAGAKKNTSGTNKK